MNLERKQRLEAFYARLTEAPPPASHDEALLLIQSTLNAVEDAMSGVPYDANVYTTPASDTQGRMYPPALDAARDVPRFPWVTRYRTKGHNIYIAAGGALEIHPVRRPSEDDSSNTPLLRKLDPQGRTVWEATP